MKSIYTMLIAGLLAASAADALAAQKPDVPPVGGNAGPAAKSGPKLDLPPVVYAAPGIECNLYYSSIFDAIAPENFVYLVQCARGKPQDHRWCWTPDAKDAGKEFPLKIEVRDDHGVVARGECVVRVAAPAKDPKRKITLALLAASSVSSGYPQWLMETMHANGFANYTPVGTYHRCGLPVKPGLAASDGYGGWAWQTFLTQWAYSDEEFQNVQDQAEKEHMKLLGIKTAAQSRKYQLRSPLLKAVGGKVVVDIQGWFDRINGGRAPDFIVIDLGGNDIFGPKDDEKARAKLENEILPNMVRLTDLLRKAAPNATIGICQQPEGCRFQSAFAANYDCRQSRFQFRRNKQLYNALVARFVAERKDPEIVVLPYYQNVDPVWGYPSRMLPANAHEKTPTRQYVNALHTTTSGAHQIADAMYCWLVNQIVRKGW